MKHLPAAVVKVYREVEPRKRTDLLLRHIVMFLLKLLQEAIEAFNEMKQEGLSPKFDIVSRIEVKDERENTYR